VDVTVKLLVDTAFPLRNVTAYLTDKIGPGTTAADEIAPSFTFPGVAGPFPFQPTLTGDYSVFVQIASCNYAANY
jgi:hypothetical protein